MLSSTRMMRAALAVAFVAVTSSAASAGTYVGLGIGTNAISDDQDRLVEDGRSGRLLLGMRFGQFSIEGMFSGYGVALADQSGNDPMDAYQFSIAGKFNLPLGSGFEAYGRAGLQHTRMSGGAVEDYDVDGNGFLVGAGFEYRLNLGIGSGSIWVDYQINKAELEGDRFMFDATSRAWTLGLSIGI